MSFLDLLLYFSLFFVGFYLLLGVSYTEAIFGLILLSNAINLLLLETSHTYPEGSDPLPQALILTAIVIGFALSAFLTAFALSRRESSGSDAVEFKEIPELNSDSTTEKGVG